MCREYLPPVLFERDPAREDLQDPVRRAHTCDREDAVFTRVFIGLSAAIDVLFP